MRIGWLKVAALLLPALTGCLSHTRKLQRPLAAGPVLSSDAVQLVAQVNQRYNHFSSLTATVHFTASVGGAHRGQQTDYTSIRGYILFRKPQMLRVLGLVPVLYTHAFDLASNGSTFTLLIPPKDRAIEGSNSVTEPATNPLENLRPQIFLDSILIQSISPDQIVSLTTHVVNEEDLKTKRVIEHPDYDLAVLSQATPVGAPPLAQVAKPLRVIHFSRANLLPIQEDIYNANGEVETQVTYGPYRDFNGTEFPSTIVIDRPLEEYSITLAVEKLVVNQPLPDEQFQVKIPQGVKVEKLK